MMEYDPCTQYAYIYQPPQTCQVTPIEHTFVAYLQLTRIPILISSIFIRTTEIHNKVVFL